MYQEHNAFEKPADENIKIWRYIDFTKFVSLIDRKALFFSKVEKLGDKFEGAPSKVNIQYASARESRLKKIFSEEQIKLRKKQNREFDAVCLRKWTAVNSWHMNEYESAAMWKLYLKSDEGIAIQSTFKRLAQSFNECKEHNIWIGMVKYIDYTKDEMPFNNIFFRITTKRKSFEHERELRAAVAEFPLPSVKHLKNHDPFANGLYVPVNLELLIERVFVSPTAEKWFSDLVQSVTQKYGLSKSVSRSSLADDPVF